MNTPTWPSTLFIAKPRLLQISNLALPIIAGAIATNLMTIIDTAMVGQLGDAALAGVGIGGQLFFLFLTGVLGIAAGVHALVARYIGEGIPKKAVQVLNIGVVLAAMFATFLMLSGYLSISSLFGFINHDPAVVNRGLEYLSARLPSIVFIGINVCFRAYWIGVDLAKWSMISILSLSLANICFNYMLIFGNLGAPRLEVFGAGLGSTLATAVGLLVNVLLARRHIHPDPHLRRLPDTTSTKQILVIAYPESLRQFLFTVGVLLMYVIVGYIGTNELAAFHVIISICLIAYMPHIGLAGAATTLVGQALGRKQIDDAKLWGWQAAGVGFLVLGGSATIIALLAEPILGFFLANPETLALAILPLQLAVFAHTFDGCGNIFSGALIGAGASSTALRLTIFPQWLLLLPALAIAVFLGYGLNQAAGLLLTSTILTTALAAYIWRKLEYSTAELR